MKKKIFISRLLKFYNSKFVFTYNKKERIYVNKLEYIITHKGMWTVKLPINSLHNKKRIGELIFTRKPFKRPNKFTKKRKCYLNIYFEHIFLKNICN